MWVLDAGATSQLLLYQSTLSKDDISSRPRLEFPNGYVRLKAISLHYLSVYSFVRPVSGIGYLVRSGLLESSIFRLVLHTLQLLYLKVDIRFFAEFLQPCA